MFTIANKVEFVNDCGLIETVVVNPFSTRFRTSFVLETFGHILVFGTRWQFAMEVNVRCVKIDTNVLERCNYKKYMCLSWYKIK